MFQMKGVTGHHHFQVTVDDTHIQYLSFKTSSFLYIYEEILSKLTSRNQTLDFII